MTTDAERKQAITAALRAVEGLDSGEALQALAVALGTQAQRHPDPAFAARFVIVAAMETHDSITAPSMEVH